MQKVFVTGAAGFIGSSLVDRLLKEGCEVVGWDNFSTGQEDFVRPALKSERFALTRGDNLDLESLTHAMAGCDFVFHFAANADVRFGLDHPKRDLEQNTLATFNVLEAMRTNGVKRDGIFFNRIRLRGSRPLSRHRKMHPSRSKLPFMRPPSWPAKA